MNWHLRRGLLTLSLLTLAGCGDSGESLVRTAMNQKSELTDRLMKVKDENAAKKFIDHHMKVFGDKKKILDDKWQKWIKDVDDDATGKARVLIFQTTGTPGDAQWEKDALNIPPNQNARFIGTREAFVTYIKKIKADKERFEREKARIADLVKQLEDDEIAKGGNPKPKESWPNLVKINEPGTFKEMLLTGAEKRQ
jgi:hypothetical protein